MHYHLTSPASHDHDDHDHLVLVSSARCPQPRREEPRGRCSDDRLPRHQRSLDHWEMEMEHMDMEAAIHILAVMERFIGDCQ